MDFDKLFEKYLRNWMKKNTQFTPDEAEDMLPELYEEWVTSPCKEIGGITPEQYFLNITDPKELVEELIRENEGDSNACSLLGDRICEVPQCAPYIIDIIKKGENEKLVVECMNLLDDMGAEQPLDIYVQFIANENAPEGIRETACEILKTNANEVKDSLFPLILGASEDLKEILGDILCLADRDERTFNLLRDLFLNGKNVPFAAGLIAKYGDERAASYLYPALDVCNYLEFIEIRNAIESLGGVVDDNIRDWSDDEFYKALKGIK